MVLPFLKALRVRLDVVPVALIETWFLEVLSKFPDTVRHNVPFLHSLLGFLRLLLLNTTSIFIFHHLDPRPDQICFSSHGISQLVDGNGNGIGRFPFSGSLFREHTAAVITLRAHLFGQPP